MCMHARSEYVLISMVRFVCDEFDGNVEKRRSFFCFYQWRNRLEEGVKGERREKRGRRRNAQGVEQKFESWLLSAKLR